MSKINSAIAVYNSMAEFYASMGETLEQDVDFTINRLEEVHGDLPIKSPLFRANYYSIIIIKWISLIAEVAPPQYPNPEIFQEFNALENQLIREYQSNSDYKFKIIGSLMVVLLLKIKERFWQTYDPLNESDSSSQIVLTFKRNLEQHFRDLSAGNLDSLYQVQDYAQAQYLHPSYLSTVIKSKTGKSVNNWIAEKVIAESQAILSRSPVAIQEVASQLGFKEPGHFSRYFKKHTGISPSAFRDNLINWKCITRLSD